MAASHDKESKTWLVNPTIPGHIEILIDHGTEYATVLCAVVGADPLPHSR